MTGTTELAALRPTGAGPAQPAPAVLPGVTAETVPAETCPVVVVGAGPVGLTLALLLARRGVRAVVLERHEHPYPLPRAVHLDDEVFRILQAAGVADEFAKVSRPMPGMRLLDARLRTLAEFSRDPHRPGPFGYPRASMFDQPQLEEVLLAAAAAEPLVEVRRGHTFTGVSPAGLVSYVSDGETGVLATTWVVGADGANSLVRSFAKADFRDLGYQERWLVVDVRSAVPLDVWGGTMQVCDPARAATFMHVVGDRYRWEFRMADHETVAGLTAGLDALIAPWTHGRPVTLVRQAEYVFRARVADRWRTGILLLAGDAAHQTPPFIGQGLGAGLRDANNLAWKLAAVLAGAEPALLDSYEVERRPHVTQVVRAAVWVGRAMTGGHDRAAALRRPLLGLACRIPGLAARAADTASPRLPAGPLVRRRRGRRDLAGTLCPQPWTGFDETVLGLGWAVISAGPVETCLPLVDLTERPDAVLSAWLAAGGAYAALIRPDRVVAATTSTAGGASAMLQSVRTDRAWREAAAQVG